MPDITVTAPEFGSVPISYTDRGQGPAVLILHGGAGSISVGGFADQLAETLPARVIAPVHPGFDSSPRPEALCTVTGLAMSYSRLLDGLELTDVTVIGNSIGGWIAAELALQSNPRVGRLVLGAADRIVPIEHGHAYADAIPRGELTVIEHAGHLPQLESPDAFLALIHDYVR